MLPMVVISPPKEIPLTPEFCHNDALMNFITGKTFLVVPFLLNASHITYQSRTTLHNIHYSYPYEQSGGPLIELVHTSTPHYLPSILTTCPLDALPIGTLIHAHWVNFSHRRQTCILRKCNSCSVYRGFWWGCSISMFRLHWSRIGYHSGSTSMIL